MSTDKYADPYQIRINGSRIVVPKSLGMTAKEMKEEIPNLLIMSLDNTREVFGKTSVLQNQFKKR